MDAELLVAQEGAHGVGAEIEALAAAETQAKVAIAELKQRLSALVANLDRLGRDKADVEARLLRLAGEQERSAAEQVRVAGDIEALRVSIDEMIRASEEVRVELTWKRQDFDQASHSLRERE